MSETQKRALTRMLLDKYGDAINVRGIIISPAVGDPPEGKVYFNIIDSRHPEFGKQTRTYSIDPQGDVRLT
jgi:hypothetical protein